MPKVKVGDITMNYDRQGDGEPLILIPYLTADSACYAFQVAEYAKHFTCISVDPRGAGESDKPAGDYSIELVRGRPAQPLDAFMRHSNAVIAHDIEASLRNIKGPTQITFGRHDMITSTRFADRMMSEIENAELVVFDGCAHAPIYEKVDEFNEKTLAFLQRHAA